MNVKTDPAEDTVAILVVEDSRTQAEQLKYLLEQQRYRVMTAENGNQALALLSEHRPTLVITDIIMPEMDGYDLCKRIKSDEKTQEIPVILLTSLTSSEDVIEGLACGADNFITKPYSEEYLLSSIERILAGRKLRKSERVRIGVEISFGGKNRFITADQQQMLSLLISTYEAAVHRNTELVQAQDELRSLNERLEDLVEKRTAALSKEIVERKRAEQILQESEERYRIAIESSNDSVVIVRGDRYVYVNQRFVETFGYDRPEDIVGKPLSMTAHPDDLEKVTDYNLRRQRGETVPSRYQTRSLRKDGREIYIDVSASRIMFQGEPASLANLRDVTHEVKLAQHLRQAQKMEAIGTLAGGIAHDFNNILTAVIGFSELARDEVAKGSSLEGHVQEVLTAGKRARDLVKQILTFSRETEREARPVAVNLILKEILKLIKASLPATIEIRQDIRSDSEVLVDPSQIHQVLMNLCTNAAHAMKEKGGVLDVGLADMAIDSEFSALHPDLRPGPHLLLTVSDTGIGMGPQILERIFDPFFTTKGLGEGTGLGLSVVHGIVKDISGTITVYSEPGKGTTFRVYLPVHEGEEKEAPPLEIPVSTGHESILVVDDEPSVLEFERKMLERLGYKVTAKTSSLDALELFRRQPEGFDLVITDMTMPKMTGEKLAEEIMQIRKDIPVILCTGFSREMDENVAKAKGIQAFLMKPIITTVMAGTVRKVLDKGKEEVGNSQKPVGSRQ